MTTQPGKLILLADSDTAWLNDASTYLLAAGYKTAVSSDFTRVTEMILHLTPETIVVGIDTYESSLRTIFYAASQCFPPIPVIITSAAQGYENPGIAVAFSLGAFDCLLKPHPYQLLERKITQALLGRSSINLQLYEAVNKKLHDLEIVSSYSGKLMNLMDKHEVLRLLCETAVKQLHADFAGFFVFRNRAHEFLYWSRYAIDEKTVHTFGKEAASAFHRIAESELRERRVVYSALVLDTTQEKSFLSPPLIFRHTIPLCWDDLKFGSFILGATKEPEDLPEKMSLLSNVINRTHAALINAQLYGEMKENYIRTIKALAIAVDAKDAHTHGHSENVMHIAEEIARELSIDEKTICCIRDAGLLHDIGKIGIPGYILNKPGNLTDEEYNGIMKTHSTLGANIVRDVPFLRDLYRLILYHHEHYNGNGYPDGLRGEQIPLGARIIHVADAFEAMTSDRPYRTSLGKTEAIKRLRDGCGQQFDPSIIEAFLRISGKKFHLQDTDRAFPFIRQITTP